MATVEAPTRLCPQCWTRQPIDQFRRRRKESDYRHSQCNGCRTAENRRRAVRKRQEAVHGFTQAVKETRSPGAIQALVDEMGRRFGGVANFVNAMMEAYEAARQSSKHKLVLQWFEALANIIRAAEQLRPDPTKWSDEEIGNFVLDHMAELINAHPEILFSVAEEHGYVVIPPEDVEGAQKEKGDV